MADDIELAHLKRLLSKHENEKPALSLLNLHYEGKQPLSYMHPELQAELGDRIRQVIINWPRLVVDSLEERLDIEGFRYAESDQADDELQRVWQANNLDEWSQQGHVEALVMRRAFVIGSPNEADRDTPIVSVESPLEVYAERDPATRKIVRAVKSWKAPNEQGKDVDKATLYQLNSRIQFTKVKGQWVEDPDYDRFEHNYGHTLVSALVNRPRLRDVMGVSELVDIIPVSDAACKIATDLMVAAEKHAVDQRWVFGMKADDFKDPQTGQRLSSWQAIMGRIWASENKDAKAGVFPAADLKNFHETMNLFARIVGSLAGLSPHDLGFTSDNPASADAIRSGENRLIKRAERRQRMFGGGWEDAMRLVRRIQTGAWEPEAMSLESIWRNPATPTIAQSADAAVKLHGQGIVPLRQTRQDLGYSPAQIDLMEQADEEEDPMARLGRPAPTPTPPTE